MVSKQKGRKVKFQEGNNNSDEGKQMVPQDKVLEACNQSDAQQAIEPQRSDSVQETVTSSESTKKRLGAARGVSALHKVLVKKARGKKFKIRYNEFGVPIGNTRKTLQSYIGMLARTMIPIDISNWTKVDADVKAKLWDDVKVKCILTSLFI